MSRRRSEERPSAMDQAFAEAGACRISEAARRCGVTFEVMQRLASSVRQVPIDYKGQTVYGIPVVDVDRWAATIQSATV